MLFDSHCHLQDPRLLGRIDEVMSSAGAAGVGGMLCCGAEESDWQAVMRLCARFPSLVPALGLHPLYISARSAHWLEDLRGMLEGSEAAVGEIGLDHAVEPRDDGGQEEVFVAQMSLAGELDRAVSVHCRRAWGRMMEIVRSEGMPGRGMVFHSFSGSVELVGPLCEMGGYISFSGTITRSGNRRGHEAAKAVPWDRLMIETDSPDLLPVIHEPGGGIRKGANEPGNLTFVVKKIAELRGVSEDEVAETTWANARRVFCAQ